MPSDIFFLTENIDFSYYFFNFAILNSNKKPDARRFLNIFISLFNS
jgi:hypothetical protein